jgi:hypothetical protein
MTALAVTCFCSDRSLIAFAAAGRARAGGACLRPTRARRSLFTGLSALTLSTNRSTTALHSEAVRRTQWPSSSFPSPAVRAQRCIGPQRAAARPRRLRSCCLQAPIVWPAGKAGTAAGVGAAAILAERRMCDLAPVVGNILQHLADAGGHEGTDPTAVHSAIETFAPVACLSRDPGEVEATSFA